MASQRGGDFLLAGHFIMAGPLNHHGVAINAVAHEVKIERPSAGGGIDALDESGKSRIARDQHVVAALLPQKKLEQTLDVPLVGRDVGAFMRQHRGPENRYGAVFAFQRDIQRIWLTALLDPGVEGSVPQRCGQKIGIQYRTKSWGYIDSGHLF